MAAQGIFDGLFEANLFHLLLNIVPKFIVGPWFDPKKIETV